MLGDTYKGSKNNLDKFVYDKSLNLPDLFFDPAYKYAFAFATIERLVPPFLKKVYQEQVEQRGVLRPPRTLGFLPNNFMDNLVNYVRNEIDAGRYLFLDDNTLMEVRQQARFIGERLTRGEDRVLPVRQIGETIRATRRGGNVPLRTFQVDRVGDSRTFSVREEDILRDNVDLIYSLDLPVGILSAPFLAIKAMKAIENLEGSEEPFFRGWPMGRAKIAPRINKYNIRDTNDTLFTIRGTKDIDDVVQDLVEGATELSKTMGVRNQLLEKKIDLYEDFIMKNKGSGKVILAGHSLGALESSHLVERLTQNNVEVEAVSFGQPVFAPHSKVDVAYSFDKDPLYRPNGRDNHKVIQKTSKIGKGFLDFTNAYHGIENYF